MTTTIETDLRCFSCGYNLRALSAESACPECGTPISKSIPGEDTPWHTAIRQGLSLLVSVTIGSVVYVAIAFVVRLILKWQEITSTYIYWIYDILEFSLSSALGLLLLWSLWKIGTPRSAGQGPLAYRRRALRLFATIYAAIFIGYTAIATFFPFRHDYFLLLTLSTINMLVYIAREWMLWTCMRYLLASIRQVPMSVHANVIRWIVLTVNLLLTVNLAMIWIGWIQIFVNPGPWEYYTPSWLAWIKLISSWGVIVTGIWGLIFFIRARIRVAAVSPGTFGGDLRYFSRIVGKSICKGWQSFVTHLRHHGPATEKADEKQDQTRGS